MRRPVWTLIALSLALAALAPADVAAQDDVLVLGQHTITMSKSGSNDTTNIREVIHYSVDAEFSGTLAFDLDPQSEFRTWFLTDANGTPLPGEAGQSSNQALPSEDTDGFKRFNLDLSSVNVTFRPGQTYSVQIFYNLPGDDGQFTRRLNQDTPQLSVIVQSAAGLEPVSEQLGLRSLGNSWTFTLDAEDEGPYDAGQTFTIDFQTTDVPREPLSVGIRSQGEDPVRLTATAQGGIPPYSYAWDLDDDGECDDADTQTVSIEPGSVGAHTATVCVTDGRETAEVRDTFELRTVEGPVIQTGPTAWLLGLVGLVIGALLVYGLIAGGLVSKKGARPAGGSTGARSYGAESKEMLAMRQRVMVAALKELEIAKKKGEVQEGLYTPLKAELKQDTVRVMRELEKRKGETV